MKPKHVLPLLFYRNKKCVACLQKCRAEISRSWGYTAEHPNPKPFCRIQNSLRPGSDVFNLLAPSWVLASMFHNSNFYIWSGFHKEKPGFEFCAVGKTPCTASGLKLNFSAKNWLVSSRILLGRIFQKSCGAARNSFLEKLVEPNPTEYLLGVRVRDMKTRIHTSRVRVPLFGFRFRRMCRAKTARESTWCLVPRLGNQDPRLQGQGSPICF